MQPSRDKKKTNKRLALEKLACGSFLVLFSIFGAYTTTVHLRFWIFLGLVGVAGLFWGFYAIFGR